MEQQNIIRVDHWGAVCVWSFKANNDVCIICKNKLTQICATCMSESNVLNKDCFVSSGKCGHAYHKHCISRWLQESDSCPLDNAPWKYSKVDMNKGRTTKLIRKSKR